MSNTCISYADAEDIVKAAQETLENGERLTCVTIPGVDKFLSCVDVQALLREAIKARNLKIWSFFTLSFGSSEGPFIFVFIKRPGR